MDVFVFIMILFLSIEMMKLDLTTLLITTDYEHNARAPSLDAAPVPSPPVVAAAKDRRAGRGLRGRGHGKMHEAKPLKGPSTVLCISIWNLKQCASSPVHSSPTQYGPSPCIT